MTTTEATDRAPLLDPPGVDVPPAPFLAACAEAGVDPGDQASLWTLHCNWKRDGQDRDADLDDLFVDYDHWRLFSDSRTGDAEAAAAFERHWRIYARTSLARRVRPEQADDLLARFFVRAYRLLPERFHFRCPFTAYLRAMLLNLARDLGRTTGVRLRREVSLDDDDHAPARSLATRERSPEQIVLDRELSARVRRALFELNPGDRAILRECQLEDGLGNEVAVRLGITPNALYQRLSRARKRLRRVLTDDGTRDLLMPAGHRTAPRVSA